MRKAWGKVVDLIKLIYAYISVLLVFGSLFALIALIALVIMVSLVEFWHSNKILFVVAMLFLIHYAIIGLNWVIEIIK
ncbi:MAG: hypothetical protein [Bacteriophage sp.]|nr:MAG: hypothetical protein [Bacteriophage sp.]